MTQDISFDAFLMPTHLNFRWNYDALVPALLYFDSVTFVNDDVGVRDKLVDPATLTGCDPDSVVEGFVVQQHRYYWPMRELIQEGVISLRPMQSTMMPMTLHHPVTGELQIGWKDRFQEMLDREDPRARKFLYVANRYHRFIVPPSPNSKDEPIGDAPSIDISNALEVALWTRDAIRRRSTGQRRVAIHPEGQVAMDLAIEIFEDINKEMRPTDPDTADWIRQDQERDPGKLDNYPDAVALGLAQQIMAPAMPTFCVDQDPSRLAEILKIRDKRKDELGAFREMMQQSEARLLATAPEFRREAMRDFVLSKLAEFKTVSTALSRPGYATRLRLSKYGGLIGTMISSALSAMIPGAGATTFLAQGALGAAKGAMSQGVKSTVSAALPSEEVPWVSYLFYAKNAVAKGTS